MTIANKGYSNLWITLRILSLSDGNQEQASGFQEAALDGYRERFFGVSGTRLVEHQLDIKRQFGLSFNRLTSLT